MRHSTSHEGDVLHLPPVTEVLQNNDKFLLTFYLYFTIFVSYKQLKLWGKIVANKQIKSFSDIMSLCIQKIITLDRAEKVCFGLTISQAYTIGAIQKNEILTMKQLSQELGLAISTLTRIVDVLVRDNIVCRNHSEQDRRKVNICLTEKGKDLAEKLKECGKLFWTKIFKTIPEEKRQQLTDNLSLLLKAIEGAEKACCTKN